VYKGWEGVGITPKESPDIVKVIGKKRSKTPEIL
jgi:hypothetical protein